jgi:hypothetical protein
VAVCDFIWASSLVVQQESGLLGEHFIEVSADVWAQPDRLHPIPLDEHISSSPELLMAHSSFFGNRKWTGDEEKR